MKRRMQLYTNSNELILESATELFIKNKTAMNVSKETIRFYKGAIKRFVSFVGNDIKCEEINNDTIINFINYLREDNPDIKDTSINSYLRGIRSFLYYLMERGYMPAFNISLIRATKQIKETYSDEELNILLKKPSIKESTFATYRNWVIINYLIGTGNRSRTIRNIKIKDLDFVNHELRLNEVKNGKAYIIPITRSLEKTLQEYLEHRKGNSEDYLFCNSYGEQLTKFGLRSCVKEYNLSRGIDKTSIHLFRHTFAKKWILNRGDIFTLQKILGHSSLDIVKEYVNIFGADLHRNFEAYNPLESLQSGNRDKIRLQ